MTFTFLHTTHSNVGLFSDALAGTGLSTVGNDVRDDLLKTVTERGRIDEEMSAAISSAILTNAAKADQVLLTCSSLGPVADRLKSDGVAVERTDRLLADAIFSAAAKEADQTFVAVLVVAPTTIEATRHVFTASLNDLSAKHVDFAVHLLPEVWSLFLAGDLDGYRSALATEIDQFLDTNPDVKFVALGQASMGPALVDCESERASDVWTIADATRSYLIANAR